MIAGIAIGALALVVGFATWSRVASRRAERRSVTTHQHALDVLGTASRRWEGVAPVRLPKPDEVARAHVQPTGAAPNARRRPDGDPAPTPHAGVRLVPPAGSPLKLPIFIDEGFAGPRALGGAVPGGSETEFVNEGRGSLGREGSAALFDHEALAPPVEAGPRGSHRRHRGRRPARRAASVAATAVAVAAMGVAGWQLASGGTSSHHPAAQTSGSKTPGTSLARPGGRAPGQGLAPTSVSGSVVTYAMASPHYTVAFSASGPCWLGVEATVNGRYLWQTTLVAGGRASYRANGSIAVRIGAPRNVSVRVDGVNVELPAKNVQPYDITFSPPRGTTA
ncbi:MAG TPA: DUF4115 domain-containing protein [Acidimicrobiales bacterium]|nr:DUF4115 domain-containing protein [Acidimicrobiales bacterium]